MSDMMTTELMKRFGAQGRIAFRDGLGGYPEVVLANKFGTATVSLLSGNTLSYRPTGQSEVIFRPAKRDYNRADKIHGGVPVCWPWFGKSGEPGTQAHGIARLCVFDVRATEYSDEMTEVTLGLKSSAATRELWPHDFDLELKVSVSMKLNLTLTTKNTGTESFLLTEGFHPYFLLGGLDGAYVRGAAGLDFIDARDMSDGVISGDFPAGACDHVITLKDEPKHEFALIDPKLRRAIALASRGNKKLVIWNPGTEEGIGDLSAGDAGKFICVEPATLWRDAGFTLAPGESHTLEAAIQSTLENV